MCKEIPYRRRLVQRDRTAEAGVYSSVTRCGSSFPPNVAIGRRLFSLLLYILVTDCERTRGSEFRNSDFFPS